MAFWKRKSEDPWDQKPEKRPDAQIPAWYRHEEPAAPQEPPVGELCPWCGQPMVAGTLYGQSRGAGGINGLQWREGGYQGFLDSLAFTGKKIPDKRNREILHELQREMENIVLIGMPGCGKSTVGQLLADRLGRSFIDSDTEIVKKLGCSNIKLMVLLAAPEGVALIQKEHPDVDIYCGAVDEKLNEKGYIVPGLGDAGDRIFGTK